MIDKCSEGWNSNGENFDRRIPLRASDHCVAHINWESKTTPFWSHSGVLQLGGLAQAEKMKPSYRKKLTNNTKVTTKGFKGCVENLRINDLVRMQKNTGIILLQTIHLEVVNSEK